MAHQHERRDSDMHRARGRTSSKSRNVMRLRGNRCLRQRREFHSDAVRDLNSTASVDWSRQVNFEVPSDFGHN